MSHVSNGAWTLVYSNGQSDFFVNSQGPSDGEASTTNFSGCHFYGPYIYLQSGEYEAIFEFQLPQSAEGKGDIVHISFDVCSGMAAVLEQSFYSVEERNGVHHARVRFRLFNAVNDVEIRVLSSVPVSIKMNSKKIFKKIPKYVNDFAFVCPSFRRDIEWAYNLFRSYDMHVTPRRPFYFVVPASDALTFSRRFKVGWDKKEIQSMPLFLSEEEVFEAANINRPSDFNGWHVQQLIKLGFSKLKIAEFYCTLDSAMLFSKKFDWTNQLFRHGTLVTAAYRHDRKIRNNHFKTIGELGWLHGKLVNISESFEFIENSFGNESDYTHHYIGESGFFSSDIVKELQDWAIINGYDGLAALIAACPYEFAWYGSYVANKSPSKFLPHGPHILLPCHELDKVAALNENRLEIPDHLFGVQFQPPASEVLDPERVFSIYNSNQKLNSIEEDEFGFITMRAHELPYECHLSDASRHSALTIRIRLIHKDQIGRIRLSFHGDDPSSANAEIILYSVPDNLRVAYNAKNQRVTIAENCSGNFDFHLWGEATAVTIGDGTSSQGLKAFICDGGLLDVARDCMFSDEVVFHVGDNHAVIDLDVMKPINYRPNPIIKIDDHVWLGNRVSVIGDSSIGKGCVVAAGSIVKGHFPEFCLLAGNRAIVKKTNVSWTRSHRGDVSEVERKYLTIDKKKN